MLENIFKRTPIRVHPLVATTLVVIILMTIAAVAYALDLQMLTGAMLSLATVAIVVTVAEVRS